MEQVLATETIGRGLNLGRVAISLAVVLSIATVLYLLDGGAGEATSTPITGLSEGPGPKVGQTAPDFEGATLDGDRVRLSDLKGKQVWINFWASWCPPCRAETPDIIAAFDQHKDRGLVLLMVNLGETADAARQYVQASKLNGTVVLDPERSIAARYHINGIPTHIFIGADGSVQRIFVGSVNRDLAARYLGEIVPK